MKRAVIARLAAEWVVQHVVPVHALERVYVNFPDPWPKTRHEESRLLRPSFLEMLTTRLTDSGEVWLTTDHPGYLEFALESARATNLYEITRPERRNPTESNARASFCHSSARASPLRCAGSFAAMWPCCFRCSS